MSDNLAFTSKRFDSVAYLLKQVKGNFFFFFKSPLEDFLKKFLISVKHTKKRKTDKCDKDTEIKKR